MSWKRGLCSAVVLGSIVAAWQCRGAEPPGSQPKQETKATTGPLASRSAEKRQEMLSRHGGTAESERAVAGALNWLARHQNLDGSWCLTDYRRACKDDTCTGPGQARDEAGATALALLPFLAVGQTQNSKGAYRATVLNGLRWLMRQQKDGDLAPSAPSKMYSHGLATIALCEAYALTRDRVVGARAQHAILFIQAAQHPGGGWRYNPGEAGDTSVTGLQILALRSGQTAGLDVRAESLRLAQQYLKSASKGGQFAYQPDVDASPAMTAIGLLCQQHLGMKRADPDMAAGVRLLLANVPQKDARNIYYWYYANLALYNMQGAEWKRWNPPLRDMLIAMQCREGCATGSWDPDKPTKDCWGDAGGRIMTTSLSALTLEVYYRYMPVYAAQPGEVRHRFVCVDNRRNLLLHVDQLDPARDWSKPIPAGSRDLQCLPGGSLLVSHGNGAAEYDLATGRRLAWGVDRYAQVNTALRLASGETLLGANSPACVVIYRLDRDGKELDRRLLPGLADLRLLRRLQSGNVLLTVSGPCRAVEIDPLGKIVWQASLPDKGYKAVRLPNAHTLVSTGGESTVVEFDAVGGIVASVGGKKAHPQLGLDWASGFDVLPSGNIVLANWLGHGALGKGPHLVEFDRQNRVVWQWGRELPAATVTNVLMLDADGRPTRR